MKDLNNIIDFYLNHETSYALLITGDWGSGKTYYYKNIINKQISETSIYSKPEKKYISVLISLFGIKNIEDLQREIFLSIYPILKSRSIQITRSVFKSLARGIMSVAQLGKIENYIEDFDLKSEGYIDFSELVICLDDLERISSDFKIKELIGYINSLVENQNVKIVIIANERKIDQEEFLELKEKVIGTTIKFSPDMRDSYQSLVNDKFSGNPDYKELLTLNVDKILNYFPSHNLRTLNFALSYFREVYFSLIEGLKTEKILKDKKNEILNFLLRFALSISIEYRNGKITFEERKQLDIDHVVLSFMENSKSKEQSEKPYYKGFIEKYYKEDKYFFFKSIYDFLTGGSSFDVSVLISELKANYYIKEEKISRELEVFGLLGNPKVFSLYDEEYVQYTNELMEYMDQGKYDIINYMVIFYYIMRFNNPLDMSLEEVKNRVIVGLKKGYDSYKYIPSIATYLRIDENSEYKKYLEEIRTEVLCLNEKKRDEDYIRQYKDFENSFYTNFDRFKENVFGYNSQFQYNPVFVGFNSKRFFDWYIATTPSNRWDIGNLLSYRYEKGLTNLKKEYQFLKELLELIEKKAEENTTGLTWFVLNDFKRILKESIKFIE